MRSLLLAVFTFAAVVAAPRIASAAGAVGTWQSDSGNTFVIPDSRTDFDLIMTRPDGQQTVYRAAWVQGMVGTQFAYGNPRCTATINRRDPDVIHVACPQQNTTWVRVAQQHGRPGGIVGTWHSTSGFHFAIPKFSRGEFDILMTAPNGVKTLMKGDWVEGMVGTQFIMGKYTCTFNSQDPDEIRVVASDEKFIWQRD
jgi:hypothetical protein